MYESSLTKSKIKEKYIYNEMKETNTLIRYI